MKKTVHMSALTYILLALVPYTRQNLSLTFSPNQFFNELEKTSRYSHATLKRTLNRAKRNNLVSITDNLIELSSKGLYIVQPFIAEKLTGGGHLMVIFDIPEDYAYRRRRFRIILRHLDFRQVQQSVWMSDKDHRQVITESIMDLELEQWVELYEAAKIDIII